MFKKISSLMLGLLLISSCATLPSGKKAFLMTSEGQENQQGIAAYKEILKNEKETTNTALANQIKELGRRIVAVSGKTDLPWEFKILDSDQPNAFALPGGKVAIYTGILKIAQTEAGLAAVVGHEIGHVLARHGGQRMSGEMAKNAALMGTSLILSSQEEGTKGLIIAALGGAATVGFSLPFSRSHETEADEIGLVLMAKAGYDPRAAIDFWDRFSKIGGGSQPEFLSTHPNSGKRRDRLRELLPAALEHYNRATTKFGKGRSVLP